MSNFTSLIEEDNKNLVDSDLHGAAVDIPYKVYKLLAGLGFKLYFFRLPYKEKTEDELF